MESIGFKPADGEDATVIDGEAEDVTGLQENIDAQLSEMFEQFGGDENDATFKINIYRVQEGRGELGYCFSCVPSELPVLDKIRDDYGPGKYEIRVYEKTDRTRLKKRTKLVIETAVKKPVTTPPPQQDMAAVLAAMAEMQQRNHEQIQQLLTTNQNAQPTAPTSMQDMIQAFVGLKELMPAPPKSNDMDMFLKGVTLMKEFAGEAGGGEKGLYDMLITAAKEFGGPIIEMSKTMATMQPPGAVPVLPGAPQPGVTVLPPGAVVHPAPGAHQAQPEPSEADQMGIMLTMQINNLVSKAAAGKDPALYADLILDSMNEPQIREFLGQPNLRDFLVSVNPQVSNYWPWFEQLQTEVLAGLESPGAEPGLTIEETGADTGDNIETEPPEVPANATEKSPAGDVTGNT